MAKGGSKFFTGLIAFLLGFILGILAIVGAVAGVCVYVVNTDLDSIFNTIGLKNKDDDGNYIYINTDSDNGGAKNVGELFTILKGYLYSEGSSSMDYPVLGKNLDEINNLLPVVQSLLSEKLYPVIDGYVDVDWEEFESVTISELPQFLSEVVYDVRPAKLLEKLGMEGLVGEEANIMVRSLLAGAEFDYAYSESGLKFPVYYDTYVYNEDLSCYYREEAVNGQQAYPDNLDESLLYDTTTKIKYEDGTEKTLYRLYFIPCAINGDSLSDAPLAEAEESDTIYANGTSFIAVKYSADDDKYVLDTTNGAKFAYLSDYGYHNIDRTGNYYYTNDNSELQIYPVTVRSFSDPDEVFKPLYSVSIKECLTESGDNDSVQDGNGILGSMFGNLSVGEMLDGKINFDEKVNNLELAKVVNVDPKQPVMAYIGYGLSRVNDEGTEGYIDIDGVSTKCFIKTELQGNTDDKKPKITRVWYIDEDGQEKEVKGKTVKEVGALASDMQVTALLNVKADDAILSYLGYGMWGVTEQSGEGFTHKGKCEIKDEESGATSEVEVFVNTDAEGYVTDVWYMKDGFKQSVSGTTVSGLSDKISTLTDKLALPDVLDIKADQTITAYVGYGITHVAQITGEEYSHVGKYDVNGTEVDCFIKTNEDGKITSVWYMDGANKKYISGTAISKLPDRIDGISNDLTLGDVMDVTEDDSVLWALKDSKICDLGKDVKNLKIKDVLDKEDIANSLILKQLANNSIDELSDAIDSISMQIIYCKEIYRLPDEGDPFEVVPFVAGKEYFEVKAVEGNKYEFTSVGTITEEQFNAGMSERKNYFVKNENDEYCIVGFSAEWLFYVKEGDGIKLYDGANPDEDARGKMTEMPADGKYYSYGFACGMWKLVLYRNAAGVSTEKAYTLNNFGNMINNCTVNIYNAELFELQDAGIIDKKQNLSKTLVWAGGSKQLGKMTFKELMDAVIGMTV